VVCFISINTQQLRLFGQDLGRKRRLGLPLRLSFLVAATNCAWFFFYQQDSPLDVPLAHSLGRKGLYMSSVVSRCARTRASRNFGAAHSSVIAAELAAMKFKLLTCFKNEDPDNARVALRRFDGKP